MQNERAVLGLESHSESHPFWDSQWARSPVTPTPDR